MTKLMGVLTLLVVTGISSYLLISTHRCTLLGGHLVPQYFGFPVCMSIK